MKTDFVKDHPLLEYIDNLLEDRNFTGQIRINVHKGSISTKVEVKQSHHLKGEGEKNVS